MALLNDRKWIAALPVFLVLVATACWWTSQGEPSEVARSPFPHAVHVEDQGMDCALCHESAESDDAAGMPTLDACVLCHEFLDEAKPEERRLSTLYAGVEGVIPGRGVALADEVIFSHASHAAAGLDCAECHGELAELDHRPIARDMASCVTCHDSRSVDGQCSVCHQEIGVDTQPASHDLGWSWRHGKAFLAHPTSAANDCSLCHQESSCQECHDRQAPRDHTSLWRRFGHGVALGQDRERCATCHTSSQCEACHEVARPRSHRAGFAGPRHGHCVQCHLPLDGQQSCATCHRSTPSHDFAAPLPPDHSVAMNCRQCHGISAPLPHVDAGTALHVLPSLRSCEFAAGWDFARAGSRSRQSCEVPPEGSDSQWGGETITAQRHGERHLRGESGQ